MTKQKIIIVFDFINIDNVELSKLVTDNKISQLSEKTDIFLYHTANHKLDTVSLGLNKPEKLFTHPAVDLGGLTNLRQMLKTTPELYDKQFEITHKTIITEKLLDDILNCWKNYYGKTKFYGYDNKDLKKVIQSLIKYLHNNTDKYNGVYLKFSKLEDEYRIIATSHDIQAVSGNYYSRIYGKGDDNYAKKIKPNSSLYCAVTNIHVTPNINRQNILNEYI